MPYAPANLGSESRRTIDIFTSVISAVGLSSGLRQFSGKVGTPGTVIKVTSGHPHALNLTSDHLLWGQSAGLRKAICSTSRNSKCNVDLFFSNWTFPENVNIQTKVKRGMNYDAEVNL
jgi:hypothetical protein